MSPEFLDAYPDMFGLSDMSVQSPSGSLGSYADPYAFGYYDMAPDHYGMHGGDYVGDDLPPVGGDDLSHRPPEPPPAAAGAASSSHHGSRGASVISEEGFMRL